MNNAATNDRDAFVQMASEFPVRTAVYTFSLPAFGLLQLINGVVHGGSVGYIALFAAVLVVVSVKLTQYHVAIYRRKKLTQS